MGHQGSPTASLLEVSFLDELFFAHRSDLAVVDDPPLDLQSEPLHTLLLLASEEGAAIMERNVKIQRWALARSPRCISATLHPL